MFWDIVIAVGAAGAQAITAYLGWRLAVNPIAPDQKKRKAVYEFLFIFVGLCGMALVGLAAYRVPRERAHIAVVPTATFTESGKPPSWLNGAGFLRVNLPLSFNLNYEEAGSGIAVNLMMRRHAFIEPDQSETSETDARTQFENMKNTEPLAGLSTLGKGETGFVTARGPVLSPEDHDNLVFGRRVVFLFAEFVFSDDAGRHTRHFCQSLQAPEEGGNLIWGNCTHHNDEE